MGPGKESGELWPAEGEGVVAATEDTTVAQRRRDAGRNDAFGANAKPLKPQNKTGCTIGLNNLYPTAHNA